ncbi:MAG: HAD-IC family P-type ATPase [Syntrophales bacterium]
MKISSLVDRDLLSVNLKSCSREGVVREIIDIVARYKKLDNKKEIIDRILERENECSTGIGNGVAIPHARIKDLKKEIFFVGICRSAADFDPPDGRPVHLIILFLTPLAETGIHLQIISIISSLARNRSLVHRLISAQSRMELFDLLKGTEVDRAGYLSLTEEEIYREIDSTAQGLTEQEAARRLETYGRNELKKTAGVSLLKRFLDNLTNLLALLLWVGSILAFLAGMREVGWAIIAVIIINAVFSFWQEFKAEKALEALKSLIPSFITVIRDGRPRRIPSAEVVPGDIILFEEGDNITADARLIESHELRVDNSVFSGESRPGYKRAIIMEDRKDLLWTEIPNLVFAGTSIVSGSGRAIVIATGMSTELGKIAYLTQTTRMDTSPLQQEINRLTRIIALIAVILGIIFLLVGSAVAKLSFAASAVFAIGIIIANVPEGLLPTVTLSLAMAVQRMARRNALIKKLSSVETLGCTNVICTDKTGTLTTNRISVQKIWLNNKLVDVTGADYAPRGDFIFHNRRGPASEIFTPEDSLELFLQACILCSTAKLMPPAQDLKEWMVAGDPTEGALLVLAEKAGMSIQTVTEKYPLVRRFPFESVRKRMSSIHKADGPDLRAYVKGAPGELLELSSRLLVNKQAVVLTGEKREEIIRHVDEFAGRGLRVLGVAFRDMGEEEAANEQTTAETVEKDLVFIGLAAMYDPPRPEVKEAIDMCRKAGIRVVMITGDYGLTALSIAKEIGIVSSDKAEIISGPLMSAISDEALKEKLRKEVIFARVNPEHKLRVVNAFKEMGNIVAVTGDGVNDAPALKRADIGIAMGIRGTDVAKESAEMVLTDDNFASIVSAIEEGRAVFDNIRKFITYIFAHLVPEAIPFILYVIFKIPAPITAMQILAIDLGTETLPALALGVEKPEKGIMDIPPRPKGKGLVDKIVLFRGYIFLGLLNSAAVIAAYFFVLYQGGWSFGMQLEPSETSFVNPLHLRATTIVFAGIVVMQIANVFACRSERLSAFRLGFFSNRLIIWGILFEIVFTCALIYLPFFQEFFNTTAISLTDWALLAVFMIVIFSVEELRKKSLAKT